MSLFRCDNCGCIENTALGNYWTRNHEDIWPAEFLGKALCSECGPPEYVDGTKSEFGKWHGRFDKRSADGMLIDQHGHLWSKDAVDAGMLPKGYRIVGVVSPAAQEPPHD